MILKTSLFKKMKYWLVGFSALALCLCSLSPAEIFADSTYSIGSPQSADGRVNSFDYPSISNYEDLFLYAFWEGLDASQFNSLGYSVPTVSQLRTYFNTYFSSYFIHWEASGFNPSVLCNCYVIYSGSTFSLLFDFCSPNNLNVSPSYYSVNGSSYGSVTNNYTIFYPYYNYNGWFVPLSGETSLTNPMNFSPAYGTDTPTSVPLSTSHKFVFLRDVPYSLSSAPSYQCVWGEYSYPTFNSSNGSLPLSAAFKCLVSSFPYYTAYYSLKNVNGTNRNVPSFYVYSDGWYHGRLTYYNYLEDGIYNFTLSDYLVYSTFEFNFYPTPTPIPTIVPTLTPTPLPLAYDSNIDSFEDGETLGFLDFMSNKLAEIPQHFVAISFITSTIGYIYHYCPWASFLLFIPIIAFLSFLLGRNKS